MSLTDLSLDDRFDYPVCHHGHDLLTASDVKCSISLSLS